MYFCEASSGQSAVIPILHCAVLQVHFTLCGGTIGKLGTEKHHRKYFNRMDSLDLPGCFAMTELGCAPR